jgi:hypothetical protein
MNGSATEWDYLEGDFLARNNDPRYVVRCTILRYVFGIPGVVLGMLQAVMLARKEYVRRNQIHDDNSNKQGRSRRGGDPVSQSNSAMAFKLELNIGIIAAGISHGLISVVGAFGTVYPSTHPLGQLTDFLCVFFYACGIRCNSLQVKGATWFNSAAHGSRPSVTATTTLNAVFDKLQGPLLLPVLMSLWSLLFAGVLTKSQFYTTVVAFRLSTACRALHAMFKKRASVLTQVWHSVLI